MRIAPSLWVALASTFLWTTPIWADDNPAQGLTGPYGFVGNSGNDSLTVFDLPTGTALAPDIDLLPEGDYPYDVTFSPDGSQVWICGAVGDGVIVIDAASHAILERISLAGTAEYPVDIAFNGDGSIAYVASRDSDNVAIVDTSTYMVTGTIPVTSNFLGSGKMAFSDARNELYVVDWFSDQLHIIDAATQSVNSLMLGDSLWDLVLDPAQEILYLADRGLDVVHVFDLDSQMVTSSIGVGDDPWGIDITPDGATVLTANEDSSQVSIIDTATEVVTPVSLPAGADPRDVDISENGSVAYIPSGDISGDDAIYVIDIGTATLADTVAVGAVNPNSLAVAPATNASQIFFDGFESGNLDAWSLTSPLALIASFTWVDNGGGVVAFTDTSISPLANVVSWNWVFGNGATSVVQNPVHVYAFPSNPVVTLTVSDSLGRTDSFAAFILVQ